jgi:endonuclease-8
MDQRAFAGVGNVYKSEVLFIRRISPFARVRELSDDELRGLIAESRVQLRANRTGAWPRTTRPRARRGEELWVYDRAGKPCRACGTTIALRRQGDAGRATYYCPSCQGARARSVP